ncbi:HNH endonuclease [Ancylomarina sp. 16SWW S1-10-2]|uniref:HNH endonuclease n=1 Tax=Ancylomarina sp. 16SWW S1-10-2 TaxID=2499681 RepID=UPI0012AD60CA|nr:HNH endonuclease [Ancylomarina sp. 16SWW S1-10-2]MRT93249.1 hypothetical protein [Ancylomarina sp. 16SWW S1-10-2]
MPDITIPVHFNSKESKIISGKMNNPQFTYKDWGDEDLQAIRKHIRNHYRDQSGICPYCRKDISIRSVYNANIEHIVPKSIARGFMFKPKNLCVICCDCNEIKRNQEVEEEETNPLSRVKEYTNYPSSSNSFKIVHPHFDNYDEHILKCGDIYIDRSKKGSFTIMTCELNRKAHKYGIETSLLEKSELITMMHEFESTTSFTKEMSVINKLREYFIRL